MFNTQIFMSKYIQHKLLFPRILILCNYSIGGNVKMTSPSKYTDVYGALLGLK